MSIKSDAATVKSNLRVYANGIGAAVALAREQGNATPELETLYVRALERAAEVEAMRGERRAAITSPSFPAMPSAKVANGSGIVTDEGALAAKRRRVEALVEEINDNFVSKAPVELARNEQVCNECGDPFYVLDGGRDIDPMNPLCGVCGFADPAVGYRPPVTDEEWPGGTVGRGLPAFNAANIEKVEQGNAKPIVDSDGVRYGPIATGSPKPSSFFGAYKPEVINDPRANGYSGP